MKNNWLKIILAASLAFNLAFVSVVVLKKKPAKPAPLSDDPGLKLNLRLQPEQKKKLMAIVDGFKIDMVQHKQNILEKRIEIIEELSDPECDFDVLNTKNRELNRFENQMNNAFIETLIEINNLLDPRQRLNFLLNLSKNWFFIPQSPSSEHPAFIQEEDK